MNGLRELNRGNDSSEAAGQTGVADIRFCFHGRYYSCFGWRIRHQEEAVSMVKKVISLPSKNKARTWRHGEITKKGCRFTDRDLLHRRLLASMGRCCSCSNMKLVGTDAIR